MRKFFDRGDVVFLDFDPSLGHEQKGSLEEALWLETAASLLLCKEQG